MAQGIGPRLDIRRTEDAQKIHWTGMDSPPMMSDTAKFPTNRLVEFLSFDFGFQIIRVTIVLPIIARIEVTE